MTFWKTYNLDTSNFDRFFVGSDAIAKNLRENAEWLANNAATSYPPFNLKKVEDNKYVIEMAVAGFAKQDIELTLEDNKLLIKGKTSADSNGDETTAYLHKGIADRAFTRQFTLADNVEIENARLMNGMLKIWLEHVIPESKKPKKIDITEEGAEAEKKTKKAAEKQFLSE
jgi:molecular chaperone IbpA